MEKKELIKEYQLVEVPTQTELAIQTPEGELWSLHKAIVELHNKMDILLNTLK